jgi:hypothetical protein
MPVEIFAETFPEMFCEALAAAPADAWRARHRER